MTGIDYDAIRENRDNRPISLEELAQNKYDKAREENNYWDVLPTDTARVKADLDNDRIITYDEYREYLISQDQTGIEIPIQNKHENLYDTHHYYHLDVSFLIGIGIICITAIVISFIRR